MNYGRSSSGKSIIMMAETIKTILIVLSILEAIGIIIIANTITGSFFISLLLGIFVAVVGILFTIVITSCLQGFGELVQNSADAVTLLEKGQTSAEPELKTNSTAATSDKNKTIEYKTTTENGEWRCTCGRINRSYISTCACGKSKIDVIN